MFKELRFDVVGAVKRTEKYDGEYEAIHQFASSEYKNMVVDYDTEKDAKNACQWMRKIIEEEKIPVKAVMYRKISVLIERKIGR